MTTRSWWSASCVGLLVACHGAAVAGAPQPVRDINAQAVVGSPYPTEFPHQDARAFTLQFDPAQGTSIWLADGTGGGARAVFSLPVAVGVNPAVIGALGRSFAFTLFNAATGNRDLWVSDGTDTGTVPVYSASGIAFSVLAALPANGKLYFLSSAATGGAEAWISDGTPYGTRRLAQIANSIPDPAALPTLARAGNYLLFTELTSDTGRELWRIDLATNAVSPVADIAPGAGSGLAPGVAFGSLGAVAVFVASATGDANASLWRSDGTAAGTHAIAGVTPWSGMAPQYFGSGVPGTLLFAVQAAAGLDLWVTDGSAIGTVKIATIGTAQDGRDAVGGDDRYSTAAASPAQIRTTDGAIATTQPRAGVPGSRSGGSAEIAGTMAGDQGLVFASAPVQVTAPHAHRGYNSRPSGGGGAMGTELVILGLAVLLLRRCSTGGAHTAVARTRRGDRPSVTSR